MDSRRLRSPRLFRRRHHASVAASTNATEPPAAIPPIAPGLNDEFEVAAAAVAEGLGSAVWLGVGMVADADAEVDDDEDVDVDDEEEVVLPANGLWLTPELVVVRTDFVYPGVAAQPKPTDPDA